MSKNWFLLFVDRCSSTLFIKGTNFICNTTLKKWLNTTRKTSISIFDTNLLWKNIPPDWDKIDPCRTGNWVVKSGNTFWAIPACWKRATNYTELIVLFLFLFYFTVTLRRFVDCLIIECCEISSWLIRAKRKQKYYACFVYIFYVCCCDGAFA